MRLCADLYLQFARGNGVLPDETLAQALALACRRSVGPELLALTIWAYAERGDVDEARSWMPLLASRWDRAAQLRFPWLARWLDAWARLHACPDILSDASQASRIALSLPIAF